MGTLSTTKESDRMQDVFDFSRSGLDVKDALLCIMAI